MGKRSNFERVPRDFYPTPEAALAPLTASGCLNPYVTYAEPCAGQGDLVGHLNKRGLQCLYTNDIEPHPGNDDTKDFRDITIEDVRGCDVIITNPPWERTLLHQAILHFTWMKPTWLLFDADWMHTKQSIPYLQNLHTVISVGRLKWIPGSKSCGKDNVCWYGFGKFTPRHGVRFIGRRA